MSIPVTADDVNFINSKRSPSKKIDIQDQVFLGEFNDSLLEVRAPSSSFSASPIFVFGLPRSGSSFLYELVCCGLQVAYINTFVSRFWARPDIGIYFSRLASIGRGRADFSSDLGKFSSEPSAPHEFMYFWDHTFSPFSEGSVVRELQPAEKAFIKKRIDLVLSCFECPVIFKAQYWLTFQVPLLAELYPDAKFIFSCRDLVDIHQSILRARVAVSGNIEQWWSIEPPGWLDMGHVSPSEQVAFQVGSVMKFVDSLDSRSFETVEYQNMVSDPYGALSSLSRYLGVDFSTDGGVQAASQQSVRRSSLSNCDRELIREKILHYRTR